MCIIRNTPFDDHITGLAECKVDSLVRIGRIQDFSARSEDCHCKTRVTACKLISNQHLVSTAFHIDRLSVHCHEHIHKILGCRILLSEG